jgi:NAD(P)-dependent dehydrogenase (short-subunit alcohol dehydrogenase family)
MKTGSSPIIIGGSSRIGTALCEKWLQDDDIDNVIAIKQAAPTCRCAKTKQPDSLYSN